jgi:2-amino-4-hydroxy-6-hydroxymethyldihydropteridine diphosphokinase
MCNVILSLGSNLGNRLNNITFALKYINEKIGKILSISSIYETEPVGFQSNDNFYNLCVLVETALSPLDILMTTQNIEMEAGRMKKSNNNVYQSRVLDIDIILMDEIEVNTDNLTIPHPQLSKRKFVLVPLSEICPKFKIAKTNKTIAQMLHECEDNTSINRVNFKLNFPF